MGLFDLFKKPVSEAEQYRKESAKSMEYNADDYVSYTSSEFRMKVEDIFYITGRGTVVTGIIESGSIRVGDTVELIRQNGDVAQIKVAGIEMFRKILNTAVAGDNVGVLLEGLSRNNIARNDILKK